MCSSTRRLLWVPTSQKGGQCYEWSLGVITPATELLADLYAPSCQATRIRAMQAAFRKAEAAHPRDNAPTAGAIRNLGLLDKEDDTKSVLSSKWPVSADSG